MTRHLLALLATLLLASVASAQQIELFHSRISDNTNPRGGVVEAGRPIQILAESGHVPQGASVRIVYSTDHFATSHTVTTSHVRNDAGPHRNNVEWKAAIGPFPKGTTIEYYVEASGPNSPRTALNQTAFNGPAGENFILYAWKGARAPAPASPGQVVNVKIEELRSSQGWLVRSRGRYAPQEVFQGEARIPLVYWVYWAEKPHWALANDGNHRTFDALRQGLSTMQAKVVEVPPIAWPAKHRFVDQKVYADNDVQRWSPIGKASDFKGVDAQAQGFAPKRQAGGKEQRETRFSRAALETSFLAVREGALARSSELLARAENAQVRANLGAARGALERMHLEVVPTSDLLAERQGSRVRVSTGLLDAIHQRGGELPEAQRQSFRQRVLSLILAHEAAHVGGFKSEKLADAEAMRILQRAEGIGRARGKRSPLNKAEIRAALELFAKPRAQQSLSERFSFWLRNELAHGSGRQARLERAAEGKLISKLEAYRRADGTLRWKALLRDRALSEGAGLAKFGMALFLKELAVVAKTGDRLRIEEFFEGLASTDFYEHYGLFVLGARAGEVAYARYLERYVKPRFVNGVLKTNLVLAAGIALPQLVEGTFEGKAFAISLTSLGLSSAAVKAGLQGIKWVHDLRRGGSAARVAVAGGRLARLGGWLYAAGELAVVLYLAEEIETRIHAHLDREQALDRLADAGEAFADAIGRRGASVASLRSAAASYHQAWGDYRNSLYAPLLQSEGRYAQRMSKAARQAKLAAAKREDALTQVRSRPAIRANLERRYGSLEGFAESLVQRDETKLAAYVERATKAYEAERAKLLEQVYRGPRRAGALLAGAPHSAWHLLGGEAGGWRDPYGQRSDLVARLGRGKSRLGFRGRLEEASSNRLQSYEDEAEVLRAAQAALRQRGRADLAQALEATRALAQRTRQADARLYAGGGSVELGTSEVRRGAAGRLPAGR